MGDVKLLETSSEREYEKFFWLTFGRRGIISPDRRILKFHRGILDIFLYKSFIRGKKSQNEMKKMLPGKSSIFV
jgi:hypothetical protein